MEWSQLMSLPGSLRRRIFAGDVLWNLEQNKLKPKQGFYIKNLDEGCQVCMVGAAIAIKANFRPDMSVNPYAAMQELGYTSHEAEQYDMVFEGCTAYNFSVLDNEFMPMRDYIAGLDNDTEKFRAMWSMIYLDKDGKLDPDSYKKYDRNKVYNEPKSLKRRRLAADIIANREAITPTTGSYSLGGEGCRVCVVGSALARKMDFNPKWDDGTESYKAMKEFGFSQEDAQNMDNLFEGGGETAYQDVHDYLGHLSYEDRFDKLWGWVLNSKNGKVNPDAHTREVSEANV